MNTTAHRTTNDRVSVELATEAVIASYIHAISARHHPAAGQGGRPPVRTRPERRSPLAPPAGDAGDRGR